MGEVLAGLVIGLCTAVAQAVVLLPYFKKSGALQWVGVSMLGRIARTLLITLLSYTLLANLPTEAPGALFIGVIAAYVGAMMLTGGAAGAVIGYAQRFILEKRVARAQRWVWINVISSAVVFAAIAATSLSTSVVRPPVPDDGISDNICYACLNHGVIYASPIEHGLLFDIITGAVAAAITSLVLIDMLRHPTPQAEWSIRLKADHEHLPKDAIESQPSPEALLEAQRRGAE
jgi:hypothetical protein